MNAPLITLNNISCEYKVKKSGFKFDKYQALKDINMTIFKGETLGLIGRNGAGKSSLIKIIAGIITPDMGILHHHQETTISLLTLQLGFTPELSGVDNAIMGALLLGYTKTEALMHLSDIIEFSELGGRIQDPIRTYSSGMRARLGFSIAMKTSPDILLVDEALGVGDQAFREKSTAAMKEKMKSGQTVVFVSHQASTIKDLCTRVAWLENGVIKMIGETCEVLEAFKNS